jgi:lipopolysaccharide export system permease protein
VILIRYVLRQFLATFFFTLIALSVLFVIIHLFDNGLEKIIDRNVSIGDATMYYVTYLPFILKLLLPVATLLAALFGVGRLASSNELTAMSASGLGAMRFLAPYLVIGLLISVGQVYFNGWVVPQGARCSTSTSAMSPHEMSISSTTTRKREQPGLYASKSLAPWSIHVFSGG